MDNKHTELFVIKQSKGANLCLKCTEIRLVVGLPPDPLGILCAPPDLLTAMGGLRVRAAEGGWRRGDREGIPPQSQGE